MTTQPVSTRYHGGVRILGLCLLVLTACGNKSDEVKTEQPDPRVQELVEEACACTELACIAQRQRVLRNMLEGTHSSQAANETREAVMAAVAECTQRLALAQRDAVRQLADDLCACGDRACYDGLRDRVARVFSTENAAADLGPAMAAELRVEVERFNRCDERFSSP